MTLDGWMVCRERRIGLTGDDSYRDQHRYIRCFFDQETHALVREGQRLIRRDVVGIEKGEGFIRRKGPRHGVYTRVLKQADGSWLACDTNPQ